MDKRELETRLISFAVQIINLTCFMRKNRATNHLSNQLIRSGTSTALNFGEVQAAESKKDFIHKNKIVLKELRETLVCLKILYASKISSSEGKLIQTLKECNELISIFVKTVQTAERNLKNSCN